MAYYSDIAFKYFIKQTVSVPLVFLSLVGIVQYCSKFDTNFLRQRILANEESNTAYQY